jgi:multidrug efflux pump subunit AcrA (membrane-fusion protein)
MNISLVRTGSALLAVALLAGCEAKRGRKKEETAVPVEVGKVTVGPIPMPPTAAPRRSEAEDEEPPCWPRPAAWIEQILAEEGQRVAAGRVLAAWETDRPSSRRRAPAEADKARENFERNTRIYEKNLISKDLYDQSRLRSTRRARRTSSRR